MRGDDDLGLVTGSTPFLADLPFDGLHAVFVRSSDAHGVIRNVDTDAARALPDVVTVETAESLDLAPFHHLAVLDPRHSRYPLARGRVRHVGEAVAVVVARSMEAAIDAAELVVVDVDPLPAAASPDPTAVLLYEEAETNEVFPIDEPDEPDPCDGADLVVELDVANTRVASVPMVQGDSLS